MIIRVYLDCWKWYYVLLDFKILFARVVKTVKGHVFENFLGYLRISYNMFMWSVDGYVYII